MNVEQLRKNIGSLVRIRPMAKRLDPFSGGWLEQRDDLWRIRGIEKGCVSLQNIRTRHVREIGPDNIKEYRTDDADSAFLLLRCQLVMTLSNVLLEPLTGP